MFFGLGSGRIGTQTWHGPVSHHCGFPCPVVCMQAFCIFTDKCNSSPVLEVLKEKCLPEYQENIGQPYSRGVKDHREGNLEVCSPLQLPRRPGPSETRAWYWALIPPILLQHRGPVLSSPSPSLERDPSTAPSNVLLPPGSTSFTWTPQSLLSLVAKQVECPPAGRTWAAFSPLCPSCSCSCPELGKAKRIQGMEQRAHLEILCLCSAASIWDISSGIGSVVVSC